MSLVLTLNGANGKPNDWNHVLIPLLQLQAFLCTTGLGSTNIQDNAIGCRQIRANEGVCHLRTKVRNATAATITADTQIYMFGAYDDGTTTYPKIAKAVVTSTATTTFLSMAVVEEDIGPNSDGTVVMIQERSGKNTAGVSTVDQPIYLSRTAGGWTTARPGGSNIVQVIGRVSEVGASGRLIFNTFWDQDTQRFGTSGAGGITGITDNTTGPIIELNDNFWHTDQNFAISAGAGTPTAHGRFLIYQAASGTTADTDADEIVIESNRELGMSFLSTSTTEANIKFGDTGNPAAGSINYNHANDQLRLASTSDLNLRAGGVTVFTTDGAASQVNGSASINLTIGGTSVATITATRINLNGATRFNDTNIELTAKDIGASGQGRSILLGRNTNAADPASGFVQFENRSGTTRYMWMDQNNAPRWGGSVPTHANDVTGQKLLLTGINDAATSTVVWLRSNNTITIGTNTSIPNVALSIIRGKTGTVTPNAEADDLMIQNTAGSGSDAGMTIVSDIAGKSALYLSDWADTDIGGIIYNNSFNLMSFRTNASEWMHINSSGQVGIGTTATGGAGGKVRIQSGATSGLVNTFANELIVEGTSSNMGMTFMNQNGENANIFFADQADDDIGGITYSHGTNVLSMWANNGNQNTFAMRTEGVGIFTKAPDRPLHLSRGGASGGPTIRFEATATVVPATMEYGAVEWEGNDASTNANGVRARIWSESEGVDGAASVRIETADGGSLSRSQGLKVDHKANVMLGNATLGTAAAATNGFAYIVEAVGAPTGTPHAETSFVPIRYDGANNRLYVWNAGWKSVALT